MFRLPVRLLLERIRFGYGTQIAREEVLNGEDPLPFTEAQGDLGSFFIAANFLGGLG